MCRSSKALQTANALALLVVAVYACMMTAQWAMGEEKQMQGMVASSDTEDMLRISIYDKNSSLAALELARGELQGEVKQLLRRNKELQKAAAASPQAGVGGAVLREEAPHARLKHVGEDCFAGCPGGAGYCTWCGDGNACCRESSPEDPPECQGAIGFTTQHHECVTAEREVRPPEWELGKARDDFGRWVRNVASFEEVKMFNWMRGKISTIDKGQERGEIERWLDCAAEHDFCDCSTGRMRFGHGDKWVTQEGKKTQCTAEGFGGKDPAPLQLKHCECALLEQPPDLLCNGCAAGRDLKPQPGGKRSRQELCSNGAVVEYLWGCDKKLNRNPPAKDHKHSEAQEVLDRSVEETCKENDFNDQMDTFLDCDFVDSYLRWTTDESEWIDEGYLSYVGGPPGNKYEWAMTNLIRSVHIFSPTPIIVIIIGPGDYVAPLSWRSFPNLIVLKMKKLYKGLGFNFNKNRAMLGSRLITGIEVDSDQIVTHPGMDLHYEATRQEVTSAYPFPISPVHWMSREPGPPPQPDINNLYAFGESGFPMAKRTMRWVHAHPTWTYWALPFMHDILLVRMTCQRSAGSPAKVWKLDGKKEMDTLALLRSGDAGRWTAKYKREEWMVSDEPALNAWYWICGATKTWCKMDLEPDLFIRRKNIDARAMWDTRWFKDGVPLMFYSAHNTKNFANTDILLTVLARCMEPEIWKTLKCGDIKNIPECNIGSGPMKNTRLDDPEKFEQIMCCCVEPRFDYPLVWQGKWYKKKEDVPLTSPKAGKRGCLLV